MTLATHHLDLAITNAKILTMTSDRPVVRALGTRGGRIAVVGEDREVLAHATSATRVVDARGATVIPGLVDGHAHLDREGLRDVFASMEGLRTVEAVLDRISSLAAGAEPGQWIVTMPLGEPPYYEGEQPFPTRFQLDRVAPRNPVFIRPIWGYWRHSLPLRSVMNGLALEALGPDGIRACESWAEFERDPVSGELNGRVNEHTFEPSVEFLLPESAGRFGEEARRSALLRSMRTYNASGTTGIYEGHGVADEVGAVYRRVASSSELTVRARLPLSLPWADATDIERAHLRAARVSAVAGDGEGDEMLRFVGVSLGSTHSSPGVHVRRKARPYTGWAGFDPGSSLDPAELLPELIECARAGVQVAAMTPDMLSVFELVDRAIPIAGLRWVLGHINVLTPADIDLIRRLGLIVTTHTNRYIYKEGREGEKRAAETGGVPVPLRSLLSAGVPVSLGTDNVPTSLFGPIWHAVSRESRSGRLDSQHERIDRYQALRAATIGGALLTFDERRRGRLEPGMQADLAVLSDDVLAIGEAHIPSISAVMTVVAGRVVHDPDGLAGQGSSSW